jgi:hypothetical protein
MPEDADEEKALALVVTRPGHLPASHGNPLLPSPIASAISLFSQSASLTLRIGTTIGGFAIDGARVGTLTGLEISRSAAEAILVRAGREVTNTTRGEIGKAEAEGILERCVWFGVPLM